jgi:hypothetical protein
VFLDLDFLTIDRAIQWAINFNILTGRKNKKREQMECVSSANIPRRRL